VVDGGHVAVHSIATPEERHLRSWPIPSLCAAALAGRHRHWQDLGHGPQHHRGHPMTERVGSTRTVLHLIANLERGGAQEVVRTLVRYQPTTGWRPVVATFRDGPLRAEIAAGGIPVHVLDGRRHSFLSPARSVSELRAIRRRLSELVEREDVSAVQTHLLGSLDFLALSLRRSGGPVVLWTVHNALLDLRPDQLPSGQRWLLGAKRVGFRAAYRGAGRVVDGFVCVSDDVAGAVRKAYRPPVDRLFVIPNGVDVARYTVEDPRARDRVRAGLGLAADSRLVVVVAKLFAQKGHRVLLEALRGVELATDDAVLLVGEGPERESLERRAGELGLASIRFLGNRPDVPELLAASDLLALPSLWEGLPMALLEAMAAGLPVVATDVAGSRQVVENGENGILVPPGDAAGLARAIARLLADPTERARLGRAARTRVEREFSAARQAARHAEAYQAAIARRQGS
jgi:glycosyltransferase involved in cell wall biosynthesis